MLLGIYLSGEYSTAFEGSYFNTLLMYVIYCILVVFFYQNRSASTIKKFAPKYISIIPISMIGPTIGTHVGPNAIGVAFFSKTE